MPTIPWWILITPAAVILLALGAAWLRNASRKMNGYEVEANLKTKLELWQRQGKSSAWQTKRLEGLRKKNLLPGYLSFVNLKELELVRRKVNEAYNQTHESTS